MASQAIFALISVLIVSAVSLIGVFALSLKDQWLHRILFLLISLSAGALFGDALLHLLPESFELLGNPSLAALITLGGIMVFFAFEKFLHWHHFHSAAEIDLREGSDPTHQHVKPVGHLVIASDGIHNFIDGVIIGASYLVSVEIGIATTIAIILHEIPQEIGDFGVLLHAGFSKGKALLVNFLSALSAIVGTALALFVGVTNEWFLGAMVALGAGSFLYIAGSDLIPELHKTTTARRSLAQFVAMLIGVGIMTLLLLAD